MKKSSSHRSIRKLPACMLASAVTALLALGADSAQAQSNTRYGASALPANNGSYNSAFGWATLYKNTTGAYNTAAGGGALYSNTSGAWNTATGVWSLFYNTTGTNNTATGYAALQSNTTGGSNTATGYAALYWNSSGFGNTATGYEALNKNTTGGSNTATGYRALYLNTTGSSNVAIGSYAMGGGSNTGNVNTATGDFSLYSNTVGTKNVASGYCAMYANTSGEANAALGYLALRFNQTGIQNTAVGAYALNYNVSGSYNIGVGWSAGYNTNGSDNIVIGHIGVPNENATIHIGTQGRQTAAYMAGIHGATAASGVGVFVNNQGKLGTLTSSRKFKTDIADMDKASDAIHSLRPVTFRYKPEYDSVGVPQFGLIAEEVAEVNPDLVARDEKGDIYTVRYEAVNAMLLNEFLKQDKHLQSQIGTTEEQERKLAAQEKTIAKQQALIETLGKQLGELSRMAEQIKHRVD